MAAPRTIYPRPLLRSIAGAAADKWFSALPLKLIAGAGFVIIGALMILDHYRAG